MTTQSGIILIDKNEIIIRVYKKEDLSLWHNIYKQTFDLETFNKTLTVDAHQIIEIIAQASLSNETRGTESWHICARKIHEKILESVKDATGISAEVLTLEREQELIFKGLLSEQA